MKKQLALFALAAAAVLLPSAARAQLDPGWMDWKEVHTTVGVRFWHTEWTTWYDTNVYRPAPTENAIIPVASVRYKNFLLAGSYMVEHDFTFPDLATFSRKEYDVNFGYFLLPGLAVTVGYKHLEYSGGAAGYNWTTKGATVGLTGSAPISPHVSVYGNMAVGRPKLNDGGAFNNVKGKYFLTELGLAFPLGAMSDSLGGLLVTAGYRYQRVGAVPSNPIFEPVDNYEYTQGPVLGISYAF